MIWNEDEKSKGSTSILERIIWYSHELGNLLNEPIIALKKNNHQDERQKTHADESLAENVTQALQNVKRNLNAHQIGVGKIERDLSIKKKKLQKAQHDIVIQNRTIEVCQREINNHCCKCGGLHVFTDHKRTQREGCKRLKDKMRSLMYLQKGLVEATARLNICQIAVDERSAENKSAHANMTESLSHGLSIVESLMIGNEGLISL